MITNFQSLREWLLRKRSIIGTVGKFLSDGTDYRPGLIQSLPPLTQNDTEINGCELVVLVDVPLKTVAVAGPGLSLP